MNGNVVRELSEEASAEEQQQLLEVYRTKAAALIPKDDVTLHSCAEFVEQCKLAAKRVDDKRKAKVDPLNKKVDEFNAVLIPVRDAFKQLARAVDERAGAFIENRRQAQFREQQRAIEEANRKRAEEEAKAKAARDAAEAARACGDETVAVKLEGKAERAELKAATVMPTVVDLQSKKVDLGNSTLSFKDAKPDWVLPGWDKQKPIAALDPRLSSLVGDIQHLPDGLRWLLRFCLVSPILLNNALKSNEQFPAPFTMTNRLGGSTLRTKAQDEN